MLGLELEKILTSNKSLSEIQTKRIIELRKKNFRGFIKNFSFNIITGMTPCKIEELQKLFVKSKINLNEEAETSFIEFCEPNLNLGTIRPKTNFLKKLRENSKNFKNGISTGEMFISPDPSFNLLDKKLNETFYKKQKENLKESFDPLLILDSAMKLNRNIRSNLRLEIEEKQITNENLSVGLKVLLTLYKKEDKKIEKLIQNLKNNNKENKIFESIDKKLEFLSKRSYDELEEISIVQDLKVIKREEKEENIIRRTTSQLFKNTRRKKLKTRFTKRAENFLKIKIENNEVLNAEENEEVDSPCSICLKSLNEGSTVIFAQLNNSTVLFCLISFLKLAN